MSSGCIAVAGVVFIVAFVGVDVAKMFIGCTAVAGGVVLLMIYISMSVACFRLFALSEYLLFDYYCVSLRVVSCTVLSDAY